MLARARVRVGGAVPARLLRGGGRGGLGAVACLGRGVLRLLGMRLLGPVRLLRGGRMGRLGGAGGHQMRGTPAEREAGQRHRGGDQGSVHGAQNGRTRSSTCWPRRGRCASVIWPRPP